MRLEGKVAAVIGAGQTQGDTIGNGRAAALLFAREGARLMLVDRSLDAAKETQELVEGEGGEAFSFEADITREDDCRALAQACVDRYERIDCLHNNVGIGGGDAGPVHLEESDWDRIMDVNVKGCFLTCKHVLPVMREQQGGSIVNISVGIVAYKSSKAALNAFTHAIALGNARYGIRVNAIMPGLMNTPMAIEGISKARGVDKKALVEQRDAQVPLGRKMGTGWDTAHAALFLHSDEARFITGVILPVDGGQSARVG